MRSWSNTAVIASEANEFPGDFAPRDAGDCSASLARTMIRREANFSITASARIAPSYRSPLHELACDDDSLQFVGALADHQQRCVAIQPLHRELGRVAV